MSILLNTVLPWRDRSAGPFSARRETTVFSLEQQFFVFVSVLVSWAITINGEGMLIQPQINR
jgi:hypothetical protein